MSTTPVAKGSVQLELDASRLNNGLKSAAKNAKTQGKTLSNNLTSSIGEKLKEASGGTGIFGLGAKAGAIGAVVAGLVLVAEKINECYGPAEQLRKEFEKSTEVSEKWGKAFSNRIGDVKEQLASLKNIAGTADGLQQFQQQINLLEAEKNKATKELSKAREAETEAKGAFASWNSFAHWSIGSLKNKQEAAAKHLEIVKKANEEATDAVREAQKALNRLKNPESNPEAIAALRDFTKELEQQTAEIQGQSAEMSKLLKLKEQFNLSDKQMSEGRSAIGKLNFAKSAQELKEANEKARELVKSLEEEVLNYGNTVQKTTEEVQLDELIKKGIDEDQVQRLRQLIGLKKDLNKEYKPNTAIERGTATEISFNNRTKFNEQRNNDIKERIEGLKVAEGAAAKQQVDVMKMQLQELRLIKEKIERESF